MLLDKNHLLATQTLNSSSIIFSTSIENVSIEKYIKLVLVYKEKKLTKKVVYFSKKILELRISTLGTLNKKTGNAYMNLADAYLDDNLMEESLNSCIKSLEIFQHLFGEKSLEAATAYSALGNINFMQDNLAEAFSFYLKALEIRKHLLGSKHPLTAKSQHELAFFYAGSEQYLLALPLFKIALETRVELYRLSHPETAKSYNSLGMCHYHLFHYDEAYAYLIEALKIKEMIFPKNDERILSCKKNLEEIKKNFIKEKKDTFFKSIFLWIKSL